MLEINCSTLQFWGHGAYIDHMNLYMIKGYKGTSCDEILRNSSANLFMNFRNYN